MVSSVRSRPNHYEVLGLVPTANDAEIGRAFAKKAGLVSAHPLGKLAEILLAYETLRDPAKRRNYDRSLAAPPKLRPHQWTAAAQPRWTPFMAAAAASTGAHARSATGQAPEPHVTAEPKRDGPAESGPTTSIGMSLRELAKPEPLEASSLATKPKQGWQDEQGADARLEQVVEHILAVGRAEKERSSNLKFGMLDWRRPALALGGLVLGAGLFGALLGLSVRENASSAQAKSASAAPLGQALRHGAAPLAAPAHIYVETQMERPDRAGLSGARHRFPRERPVGSAVPVEQGAPVESGPGESETMASADSPAVERPLAADLPLSNRLVAHTLARIGYACGQVAATAPAEGEAQGAYNITCSSGQSYQARPVRGRYRFRRLDR